MTTFSIPLTTLPVGTLNFPATGGVPIADADSLITLTIDRTVAAGLNSQPATTVLGIQSWQSGNGGSTWIQLDGVTWPGGVYTAKGGGTRTQDTMLTQLNPGTGRLVRAVVTVTGAVVAVAGSISTQ